MYCAIQERQARKLSHSETEHINSKHYILRAAVIDFVHLPDHYVALNCHGVTERYFSVLSRTESGSDAGCAIVELLIRFKDFFSPTHQIIKNVQSGKDIFMSEPCSQAYWHHSDDDNVLIACHSGYSYVRGIAGPIRGNYSGQLTSLILKKDSEPDLCGLMHDSKLNKGFSGINISVYEKNHHGRNKYFIGTLLAHVQQEHFFMFNFLYRQWQKILL